MGCWASAVEAVARAAPKSGAPAAAEGTAAARAAAAAAAGWSRLVTVRRSGPHRDGVTGSVQEDPDSEGERPCVTV